VLWAGPTRALSVVCDCVSCAVERVSCAGVTSVCGSVSPCLKPDPSASLVGVSMPTRHTHNATRTHPRFPPDPARGPSPPPSASTRPQHTHMHSPSHMKPEHSDLSPMVWTRGLGAPTSNTLDVLNTHTHTHTHTQSKSDAQQLPSLLALWLRDIPTARVSNRRRANGPANAGSSRGCRPHRTPAHGQCLSPRRPCRV